jgi:hydroxyacylglutathione hydrolase
VTAGEFLVPEADRLWKVTNPTFASNTYIHATDDAHECFVVDPGLDMAVIDAALTELALRPSFIFCTHGHFDHIGSAAPLQKKYGAKVVLHAADAKTFKASNFLLMALKLPQRIELPELELVEDGFTMMIGAAALRYDAAPGHTPGSCVIHFEQAVFTGDTLLSRGMDLSRLPGANPDRLRATLRAIWSDFPAECQIYPGHGRSASFGWIKVHNEAVLRFIDAPEHPASAASR